MRKYIKYVICFILGGLVLGSIGVFATLTYSANQITYTKDNNTMYLSEAIDELYTTSNKYTTDRDTFFIDKSNETKIQLLGKKTNFTYYNVTITWSNSDAVCTAYATSNDENNILYNITYGQDYTVDYPDVTQHRLVLKGTNGGCNFRVTYHN